MELVHKAEKALEPAFKSLPPLPKDLKKGIAGITPWLALIGGVVQLSFAWWLYDWANVASGPAAWYRVAPVSRMSAWVWLGIISLVISGVIMLLAFPKLQKSQKAGWDLLFLGALFNVVYAVLSLFIDGRGGFGSLIWTLLISAVGFYVLFQIREHFGGRVLNAGSTKREK